MLVVPFQNRFLLRKKSLEENDKGFSASNFSQIFHVELQKTALLSLKVYDS